MNDRSRVPLEPAGAQAAAQGFPHPAFEPTQSLADQGHVETALAVYARIGAEQAQQHFEDACLLEQRQDPASAIASLRRCVGAQPDHLQGWLALARLGRGAEVRRAAQRALALSPCHPWASLYLAQQLVQDGDLLGAARVVNAAPLEPQRGINPELVRGYALLLFRLGNFPGAERCLYASLENHPDDLPVFLTLLDLLHRQDKLEEAEAACRAQLARRPADHQLRHELARCLARRDRWDEARALYAELASDPQAPVALCRDYAELLLKRGQVFDALSAAEACVQRRLDEPDAYLLLADIRSRAGLRDLARQTCRFLEQKYREAPQWGLHQLPGALTNRLIFHDLDTLAERFCTGRRALFDNTGIKLDDGGRDFGQIVELFCMVSGQEHVDYLEHVAFPALSATQGFDQLLRDRRTIYNIYTTPADLGPLAGFLDKLASHGIRYRVNVELLALSQDLYQVLALPIIDQVRRSLTLQSIVVMALPDAIISGPIERVIAEMKPQETVVCAMPRIDADRAYPALRERLSTTGTGLDSREFVGLCMNDFRHPQTQSALDSDSPCLRYRDMGSYFSAHNWAPPPLCFHAREEMLDHMMRRPLCGPHATASFYAIDHDFVDSAHKGGHLRLIPDSDYFFWAELTQPDRHTDFLAGRRSEDYYYPPTSRHVYAHEFKWIYADGATPGSHAHA
jgi:tetratricopeptide (TPR) repeat protein